jgi:exosortase/archaeosortase family protein
MAEMSDVPMFLGTFLASHSPSSSACFVALALAQSFGFGLAGLLVYTQSGPEGVGDFIVVLGASFLAPAVFPQSATWVNAGAFVAMPYILFGVAMLLGTFFTQSRVAFLSLLLAAATFAARWRLERTGPRLLLAAAAFPACIIGNGARVAAGGLLAQALGAEQAARLYPLISGWVLYLTAALYGVLLILAARGLTIWLAGI